ncbi:glycosyl transferase family protein [Sphingomonas sp.]|uniref:glycosyl transferase family protein n=1 Tax=Sphingomonas sp. TaxID=28214 RepID=UPI00286B9BBF|nr:glycosyl transferase family protein [Sphingomonas sp.]
MSLAFILTDIAAELALFAAVGFLLFAVDDLVVDLIYFARRLWRSLAIYSRYPRAFAASLPAPAKPGRIAVFIPAWDESAVIADMLRSTLRRWGDGDYRIFVGFYANDPLTEAAIGQVDDPRVEAVLVEEHGPTTKADCLNRLYDALLAAECRGAWIAKAIVLHDAEDLVHPLELALFDVMTEKAALVQLPVIPLPDPESRWISGHYCDEFAESHGKELVVREAVGASIPLAGVGCAIARDAIARLAADNHGHPFAAQCMTEDYELGLRVGAFADKTMFVRIPVVAGSRSIVSSRGHFPATLDAAVRQKARWIGGIALAGWERLGWSGGIGERWMRMRDRRGPLAALLLIAGYVAILLWLQLWIAAGLGAPVALAASPLLMGLLKINAVLLAWRIAMRFGFVTATYGIGQGLLSIPRLLVGNVIAMLAVKRAVALHAKGGPKTWEKTRHIFPADERMAGERIAKEPVG